MRAHYTINDPEITAILQGVMRLGIRTYCRIAEDGSTYVVPIRQQLVDGGCSPKQATALIRDLPVTQFIKIKEKEPEPDPEAMIRAAIAAAAQEKEREAKRAKAAKAEEASIRKRYCLVRQGSYHGVYNNDDATQVLFHEETEARAYLREMIHGRDVFNSFYGGKYNRKPQERQPVY